MIKTIKIDGKENYFVNRETDEKELKYDSDKNLQLVLKLDGSTLKVDSEKISKLVDGQIVVQHNNDRYIIDDGYYNTLIKAGYIIFDKYDQFNINPDDKEFGLELRSRIIKSIREILFILNRKYNSAIDTGEIMLDISGNKTTFKVYTEYYKYTFIVDTINNMVNKNQDRKENSLPYYPFKKSMDRYGTVYLSVFCEKIKETPETESVRKKYVLPDNIIKEIISELNKTDNYHYNANQVKRKLVFFRE